MKKMLPFTAAILMAAVFFGCSNQVQPVSGDIAYVPRADGAHAVAGNRITTVVSHDRILVHWEAAGNAAGYIVYRQEVVNNDPKSGTTKLLAGSLGTGFAVPIDGATYSARKKIPYYLDTTLLDGVTYRYGIATYSYRNTSQTPAVSEIVWQSAGSDRPYPVAEVPEVGSILPLPPAWPAATVTQYNTTALPTSSTAVNYKDRAKVVLQDNFSFNYTYTLKVQAVNAPTYTESSWADYGSPAHNIYTVDRYLDEGGVVTLDFDVGYTDAVAGAYTNRNVRLVLEVNRVAANDRLIIKNADPTLANEKLNSNQIVVASDIRAEAK